MSAVVAMNEETRRMEQFNDIVANIKPLMTTGKGRNQRVITGSAVVPYHSALWMPDIKVCGHISILTNCGISGMRESLRRLFLFGTWKSIDLQW